MKPTIVLLLIIIFMFLAYLLNKWLQKIIEPRKSLGRLFFYFLIVLVVIFFITIAMVLIIGRLYPSELMK